MFKVLLFETADGQTPVEDFLNTLKKMRAKMLNLLELLSEQGNELKMPYSRHLEDGIFELRASQSSNISRALYFFYADKQIIVTNGFIKKSQKTPRNEIDLAKKRRKEFLTGQKERNKMKTLKEYKREQMRDPEFAKAYEELQPEMNVIRAMIEARKSQNLTQKELSERTDIAQSEISKLEKGTRNPSIALLQRLADGMDMVLTVSFTPKAVHSTKAIK